MSKLTELKRHLRPGQVYRRVDLQKWSKAVDRHLGQLVKEGMLTKLAAGLYYYPKPTSFGAAPAEDEKLVETFLKDHRFLMTTPNAYNALGVGSTQLYNETVVYNHKRHGRFKLGNREFDFRMKPYFPKSLSEEFLLVDLLNNVGRLAESEYALLEGVKRKAQDVDQRSLRKAVREYGGTRAKKFFAPLIEQSAIQNAA